MNAFGAPHSAAAAAAPGPGPGAVPRRGFAADAELHRRETVERLYSAIRRLPKDTAALVLLYLEDMTYREIADVLEIPVGTVKSRLHAALVKLQEIWSQSPSFHEV